MGDPENCYPNGELCLAFSFCILSEEQELTSDKSLKSLFQHLPLYNSHRVPAALLLGAFKSFCPKEAHSKKAALPEGKRKGAADASRGR